MKNLDGKIIFRDLNYFLIKKNFRELKIFAVTFKKQTRAQANKGDAP